MKIFLFLLSTLVAQAALPPKSAPATLEAFYRKYFAAKNKDKLSLPFSRSFQELQKKEAAACRKYAKDEPCGLGADGDIYLDAQDFDPKLTYAKAGFKAKEEKPGEVVVTFNLFPGEKASEVSPRTLTYKMIQEKGRWVVDDIVAHAQSTRKQMQEQIDFFGKK